MFKPIFALGLLLIDILFPSVEDGWAVLPHLRAVWSGESYAYILSEPDSQDVVLIGAGSDAQAVALQHALHAMGRSLNDVRRVLLPCGHATQTRGLAAFDNVPVAASMDEAALIWGQKAPRASLQRMGVRLRGRAQNPCEIEPLTPGATLRCGTHDVRVFAQTGHSDGALAFAIDDTLLIGEGTDIYNLDLPGAWPQAALDEHPRKQSEQRAMLRVQLDEMDERGEIQRIVDARHRTALARERL